MKSQKKYILPGAAVLLAAVAAVVVFTVPRGETNLVRTAPGYAARNGDNDIVVTAAELTAGQLSVLKYGEESKIELIATLDENGAVQAALGTCQSCMGSPGAYYTQNGDLLQCNNCGLTFPMSVIGTSGSGCHPILINEAAVQRSAEGIVIDEAAISPYEPLFAAVRAH